MKHLLSATAFALMAAAQPALAQQASPIPAIAAGHTLLTVTTEGRSTRKPDLAVFSAGVASTGKTAGEALNANSAAMNRVIQALKRAGIADRDIQTSNLSLNPVYADISRQPADPLEQKAPVIVGYQVNNMVTVRQRNLADYGRVVDALVSSGANQVNGPSFQMDNADAALDEARRDAMTKARARAELYARAAGLRIVRAVSISESGGYAPPVPVVYARAVADSAQAPPVSAGELSLSAGVTVQYELGP